MPVPPAADVPAPPRLRHGPVELNLDSRDATVNGAGRIGLTEGECAVLELLIRGRGAVVPREALGRHFRGDADGLTRGSLSMLVQGLRRKLALAGAADPIDNVRGRGYALRGLGEGDAALRPATRAPAARPLRTG